MNDDMDERICERRVLSLELNVEGVIDGESEGGTVTCAG